MVEIYTEKFSLLPAQCDMGDKWKPSAILETMQDTAGQHSILLGVNRDTMLSDCGMIWVVSRLKVQMQRMPASGEKLSVETFPTAPRHMFFPRSHIFRDEQGEVIGTANSLWVTMDFASRHIAKSELVLQKMPDNSELSPAAAVPATVRALDTAAQENILTVQYTDLDVNEHVNNTKYLDWCCNALGIGTMSKFFIAEFDVNYDHEIRPGSTVRTSLTRDGERFSFIGYVGDTRHFSIGGILKPR